MKATTMSITIQVKLIHLAAPPSVCGYATRSLFQFFVFSVGNEIPDTEEASESEFNSGSHHRTNAEPVEIKEQ